MNPAKEPQRRREDPATVERGWHGEKKEPDEQREAYEGHDPQPLTETGYGADRKPEDGWGWSPAREADPEDEHHGHRS